MGDVASDAKALAASTSRVGAHLAHCCRTHGCKYHSTWCPVRDGHMTPPDPLAACERCNDLYEEATMAKATNAPRTDDAGRIWFYQEDDLGGYWWTAMEGGNPQLVRAQTGWSLRRAGMDDVPTREGLIGPALVEVQKHLRPSQGKDAKREAAIAGAVKNLVSNPAFRQEYIDGALQEAPAGAWLVTDEYQNVWVYLTEIDALRAVNDQAVKGEAGSGLRAYFVPQGEALSSVRGF